MNPQILIELANRWEQDAKEPESPEAQDNSLGNAINNAVARGERQAKRECADGLKMLVSLLGGKSK